mmetsp:Transcript_14121/g.30186  ORF Transcript_14121/g.30186 Transcript_14121/m.30186 type:complete len:283 (+) Transcript_14121:217-1065(+)
MVRIKIRAACLSAMALLVIPINTILQGDIASFSFNHRFLTEDQIPGDFVLKGTCDLERIKSNQPHETVDLGMFVKHGLHLTRNFFPRDCSINGVDRYVIVAGQDPLSKERAWYPTKTVFEFIDSPATHKILAVRDPTSFYKSAFNHICNKDTEKKATWRREHDINCRRRHELKKMIDLDQQELAYNHSPFRLKKIIMKSPKVRNVMLVDYTCIPKVISSLCEEPMVSSPEQLGEFGNSAVAQDYTDYWSMHNRTLPNTQYFWFWTNVYETLKHECCLEFVKE